MNDHARQHTRPIPAPIAARKRLEAISRSCRDSTTAKSTNRNEVHYGVKLDEDCQPIGNEPVFAYWRDFEKVPEVTDDLSAIERSLYGVRDQKVLARVPGESKILMSLKATPQRGIAIFVRKRDRKCMSESIATINGARSPGTRLRARRGDHERRLDRAPRPAQRPARRRAREALTPPEPLEGARGARAPERAVHGVLHLGSRRKARYVRVSSSHQASTSRKERRPSTPMRRCRVSLARVSAGLGKPESQRAS